MLSRRFFLASLAAMSAIPVRQAMAATPTFFRNPGCGCCEVWTERMAEAGLPVAMEDRADLAAYSSQLGIPSGLEGCHVGEIDVDLRVGEDFGLQLAFDVGPVERVPHLLVERLVAGN